jgi:hypothetical protein
VTAVFVRAIVPVVVIGPPLRPVPVATEVTVPLEAGLFHVKPVGAVLSTVRI